MYVWQPGTANVGVVQYEGHSAIGYAKVVNNSGSVEKLGCLYVQCVNSAVLSDLNTITELWTEGPGNPPSQTNWDVHYSWQNDDGMDMYPLVGTSTSANGVPQTAWTNEVDGYATDGSGTVWRFARTYETESPSAAFDALAAIGSVSRDGHWFFGDELRWQR